MQVSGFHTNNVFFVALSWEDAEAREIKRRLIAMGETPTGNKTSDREKLHRLEKEKAKQDGYVSSKYLTVSAQDIQKLLEEKKGAKALGDYNKLFIKSNL